MAIFADKYRKEKTPISVSFGAKYRKGSPFQIQRPETPPKTEYEKYREEHPVISALGVVQEKVITPVIEGAKETVQHPIATIGGIGVGATETVLGITSNILKGDAKLAEVINKVPEPVTNFITDQITRGLVGEHKELANVFIKKGIEVAPDALNKASEYVQNNKEAIQEIFEANMDVNDSKRAGAVGVFVGQQIPYIAASAFTAGVVNPKTASILGSTGKLTLSQASTIAKVVNSASNVIGDTILGQLVIDSDATGDERVKQLALDIVTTGSIEAIGLTANIIKNKSLTNKISGFNADVKSGKIDNIETMSAVNDEISKDIVSETGKTPKELLQERISMAVDSGDVNQINDVLSGKVDTIIPSKNTIYVPESQVPVGAGKTKKSKLATRVYEGFENLTDDHKSMIPEYNAMVKEDEMSWARKFVSENPDDALKILEGKKSPPSGHLYNSVYAAMSETAQKNADLGLKLSSLRSTRFGQEISILTEIDPHNPVRYLSQMSRDKIAAIGGKEVLEENISSESKKVIRSITKNNLVKTDWDAFINSISC